jgi:hypothetical protein
MLAWFHIMAECRPDTSYLVGGYRGSCSCPTEHNAFVGSPRCYRLCGLAAGERPIAVGVILGQGTKQHEVMPAFPELFDHRVGKVSPFVAANSYFHVRTSLLVVRASFLRDCIG